MRSEHESGARAGFSLIEVTIGTTIMLTLVGTLVLTLHHVTQIAGSGTTSSRLETGSRDVLAYIGHDIRRSGFVSVAGKTYPHVFDNGSPGVGWSVHQHTPAVEHGDPTDPDYGPDREIVFVVPHFGSAYQDEAGNNYFDVDVNGAPLALPAGVTFTKHYTVPYIAADGTSLWGTEEYSYVLETDASGVNELQRRINGVNPRVLARDVERVMFDTNATDPVDVPIGAVRVRLWMRGRSPSGSVYTDFAESTVRLRNQ